MKKKKIIGAIVALFLIIQIFQTDKSVPEYTPDATFVNAMHPPEQTLKKIKAACYDCHSYETKYPWYTFVAPVSFWTRGHVKNGRKKLNFSTIGELDEKSLKHLMHECMEVLEEGRMAPKGYLRMHSEVDWTEAYKEELINYFSKNS